VKGVALVALVALVLVIVGAPGEAPAEVGAQCSRADDCNAAHGEICLADIHGEHGRCVQAKVLP
jgi:hypothetical protein